MVKNFSHWCLFVALMTANFQDIKLGAHMLEMLREKQPGMPRMCMEFWTGWFDHWGENPHQVWPLVGKSSSVTLYILLINMTVPSVDRNLKTNIIQKPSLSQTTSSMSQTFLEFTWPRVSEGFLTSLPALYCDCISYGGHQLSDFYQRGQIFCGFQNRNICVLQQHCYVINKNTDNML